MTQESTYVAGKGFVDPRTGKPIGYYDPETQGEIMKTITP
jgi:hypothetical protein